MFIVKKRVKYLEFPKSILTMQVFAPLKLAGFYFSSTLICKARVARLHLSWFHLREFFSVCLLLRKAAIYFLDDAVLVARNKRRYGLCLRKALQPLLAPAPTSSSAIVSKTYCCLLYLLRIGWLFACNYKHYP